MSAPPQFGFPAKGQCGNAEAAFEQRQQFLQSQGLPLQSTVTRAQRLQQWIDTRSVRWTDNPPCFDFDAYEAETIYGPFALVAPSTGIYDDQGTIRYFNLQPGKTYVWLPGEQENGEIADGVDSHQTVGFGLFVPTGTTAVVTGLSPRGAYTGTLGLLDNQPAPVSPPTPPATNTIQISGSGNTPCDGTYTPQSDSFWVKTGDPGTFISLSAGTWSISTGDQFIYNTPAASFPFAWTSLAPQDSPAPTGTYV